MHVQEFVANKINLGYTKEQIIDLLKQNNYAPDEIASCDEILQHAKTSLSVKQHKRKNILKIIGYIAIAAWLFFKVFLQFFRFNN